MAKKFEFKCKTCGSSRLECCEFGDYSSEVTKISEDGDFEYGPIAADGEIASFECMNCGEKIGDCWEDVIEYIKDE